MAEHSRIGVAAVGCHPIWGLLSHLQCRFEEALGGVHITVLAEQRVDKIALAINGAVQVCLSAGHLDVDFVDVPGATGLSLAFGSKLVRYEWGKPCFPVTYPGEASCP